MMIEGIVFDFKELPSEEELEALRDLIRGAHEEGVCPVKVIAALKAESEMDEASTMK